MEEPVVLELVEVYRYEGFPEKRYRFHVKGTKIYINVGANSVEEAVEKAKKIFRNLELSKVVALARSKGGEGGEQKA